MNDEIFLEIHARQRHAYTVLFSVVLPYLLLIYDIKFLNLDNRQAVFNEYIKNKLTYLLNINTEDRQHNLCYKSTPNWFSCQSGDAGRLFSYDDFLEKNSRLLMPESDAEA